MCGNGFYRPWILLIAVVINIAGSMAIMGMKGKDESKCPYDLTIASRMIPSSCYANTTVHTVGKNPCCWPVFASYVYSISLYANRTGTVLLDANGSRTCRNEFASFVRSRGLVHPDFFTTSGCVMNSLIFTANAGPCRYATLADIWKVIDLRNATEACNGPSLNESKTCDKCQDKVFSKAFELLNLTNSKEYVPCGLVLTVGIWGRDPSEGRYRNYITCVREVLEVMGFIGGQSTSSLVPSPPPPPPQGLKERSVGTKRERSRIRIAVSAGIAGGEVVLLVLVAILVMKFQKSNGSSEDSTASSSLQALTRSLMGRGKRTETVAREPLPTEGLYIFTKRELQRATEDFSEAGVLGKGGSGKVYLGKLPSGKQVAIKRIMQKRKVDQFYQEVELLSRLRHPNLTSLLGYCQHRGEHMLVYEYMPGGDLGDLLFKQQDPVLTWYRRLRIALDCAEGLAHLHLFPEGAIVHRDIKPTNILLNESGQAKLSDFGVSKLIAPDFSHASTEIKGTTGYLDPEYFSVGKLTDASDVYSFGIVLLELISGKNAIINTPSGGAESIVYMTRVFMSDGDPDVRNLVDPRIVDAVDARDLSSIKMVLDIAYSCVQPYRNDRPSMVDVLNVIKEAWKNYVEKPEEVSKNIIHTDSD